MLVLYLYKKQFQKTKNLLQQKKSSRVTTNPDSCELAPKLSETALTLNGASDEAKLPSSSIAIPAKRCK